MLRSATVPIIPYFGDFNADGRTDLLYTSGSLWNVRFSTGTSFTAAALGPALGSYDTERYALVDWDSDGYDDILANNQTTQQWDLSRAIGEGLMAMVSTGYSASGSSNVTVMDMQTATAFSTWGTSSEGSGAIARMPGYIQTCCSRPRMDTAIPLPSTMHR